MALPHHITHFNWSVSWYFFPSYHEKRKWKWSRSVSPTLCDPMDCSLPGSTVQGIFPGKNTGVGCHFLLQEIFPTQGLNPGLPHCRQMLYHLSHQGSHIMVIYNWSTNVCMCMFIYSHINYRHGTSRNSKMRFQPCYILSGRNYRIHLGLDVERRFNNGC